jgi:hypothetical protein
MASQRAVDFKNFLADLSPRAGNPNFDLSAIRDVAENRHIATNEPEGVTCTEADAGGVEAMWCIPEEAVSDAAIMHTHVRGSVLMSMHPNERPPRTSRKQRV